MYIQYVRKSCPISGYLQQSIVQKESYCDVLSRMYLLFIQKVQFLEVHAGEINVVIDLEKMLEIDLKSGKTSCVQRVKKMFHIGNRRSPILFVCNQHTCRSIHLPEKLFVSEYRKYW